MASAIEVSKPSRATVVIGSSAPLRRPPRTCQRVTLVSPFQLTQTLVPPEGVAAIATLGRPGASALQGIRKAR